MDTNILHKHRTNLKVKENNYIAKATKVQKDHSRFKNQNSRNDICDWNAVAISPVTLGLYIAERHVCQKHQFSLSVTSSKKITLLYKKVQLLHFDFVKSWICRRIIRKLCICIRNKNPILIDVKYPWNIHTNVWRTVGRFCHRQYPLSMTTSANYCQLLLFVMTTT